MKSLIFVFALIAMVSCNKKESTTYQQIVKNDTDSTTFIVMIPDSSNIIDFENTYLEIAPRSQVVIFERTTNGGTDQFKNCPLAVDSIRGFTKGATMEVMKNLGKDTNYVFSITSSSKKEGTKCNCTVTFVKSDLQ